MKRYPMPYRIEERDEKSNSDHAQNDGKAKANLPY